jgi:hypothetical protein
MTLAGLVLSLIAVVFGVAVTTVSVVSWVREA